MFDSFSRKSCAYKLVNRFHSWIGLRLYCVVDGPASFLLEQQQQRVTITQYTITDIMEPYWIILRLSLKSNTANIKNIITLNYRAQWLDLNRLYMTISGL